MKTCLLALLLTGCVTPSVPPCSGAAQPAQRFACSQLPACKYNCSQTIVITDDGTAPQQVSPTVSQSRSGFSVGTHETGPQP